MKRLVFLIDDSELDNYINSATLKSNQFGGKILEFISAGKALGSLIENSENTENIPDIIFLDLKMPVMDGFDFLKEFAKLPEPVKNKAKIIMLSSSIDLRDEERAISDPHVHHYFSKPLTKEKILKI